MVKILAVRNENSYKALEYKIAEEVQCTKAPANKKDYGSERKQVKENKKSIFQQILFPNKEKSKQSENKNPLQVKQSSINNPSKIK
ncbi:MAG: hypothetical protein AABW72_01725 [archaeon]